MSGVRVFLVALGIVAAGVAGGVLWVTSSGMTARAKPGAMESSIAKTLHIMSIPKDARRMQNPMTPSPESLAEGRRHFADHCASCHGNDGRGNTEIGKNLYPPAPDMTLAATQNLTDGELYYIIENGVRFTGMPAWGAGGVNDHETWHLVLFLRQLPLLSREDMDDMKQHNPRSPAEMEEERKEEEFLNESPK